MMANVKDSLRKLDGSSGWETYLAAGFTSYQGAARMFDTFECWGAVNRGY
jgi:hypothetical protein